MIRSRERVRAQFLADVAVGIAAAALSDPVAAQTVPVPIDIGIIPSDFSGQPYYAQDRGFFARHDLSGNLNNMANGATIAAALAGGSLDVGFSSLPTLVIAHSRGLPFALLAAANLYDANSPTVGLLAVKRESKLSAAKDFNGKLIGIGAINNITHLGARAWIDDNGGDSNSVKWLEVPISTMASAVITSRIDGVILDLGVYPTLGKPGDPLRIAAATFTAIAPRFLTGGWFTTRDWLVKHPLEARNFVASMSDAAQWANASKNHRASAEILARYLKSSPDEINASPRVVYGTSITVAMVQPLVDVVARYKVIPAAFPASDLIAAG
jgi:NitT/TauT family transport system substrate-binding protein